MMAELALLGTLILIAQGRKARPMGIARALPGVGAEELSPRIVSAVQRVAAKVAPIPITITSGKRSGLRQANAMLAKLSRGEDLRALYGSAARDGRIDALLSLPRDPKIWAEVLDDWASRGMAISDHMSGNAADLRSRDWSEPEYDRVVAEFHRLGIRTLRESDHLHIEV